MHSGWGGRTASTQELRALASPRCNLIALEEAFLAGWVSSSPASGPSCIIPDGHGVFKQRSDPGQGLQQPAAFQIPGRQWPGEMW